MNWYSCKWAMSIAYEHRSFRSVINLLTWEHAIFIINLKIDYFYFEKWVIILQTFKSQLLILKSHRKCSFLSSSNQTLGIWQTGPGSHFLSHMLKIGNIFEYLLWISDLIHDIILGGGITVLLLLTALKMWTLKMT